jgi:hypothetical protein
LIDLVALANQDGKFHVAEKMYVKQVGKLMGFAANDIDEIMTTGVCQGFCVRAEIK